LEEDNKAVYQFEKSILNDCSIMLSGFIHDINNPIAVIAGQTSILQTLIKMGKLDEERALKVCEKVQKSTGKLGVIIEQMRSFYKPHMSNEDIVEVGSVLNSLISLSGTKIYRDEIEFSSNQLEEEIFLDLQPKDLSIILWNYLSFTLDLAKINELSVNLKIEKLSDNIQISFSINKELITKELIDRQISLQVASNIISNALGQFSIKSASCFSILLPIKEL
jgi:signal transduction histidine kinase